MTPSPPEARPSWEHDPDFTHDRQKELMRKYPAAYLAIHQLEVELRELREALLRTEVEREVLWRVLEALDDEAVCP